MGPKDTGGGEGGEEGGGDKTCKVGIGGGLEMEEAEIRYETKEEESKHNREGENEGVEGRNKY